MTGVNQMSVHPLGDFVVEDALFHPADGEEVVEALEEAVADAAHPAKCSGHAQKPAQNPTVVL